MRAVVLVGGLGTRLRPLTDNRPKQMLPIVDRPMIEWVVEALARHGVDDVVLSLGYRPDAFEAAYPDGRCGRVRLHYAVEPEPLDTAGAIRFAALDAGIDERFVVVNGDVLSDSTSPRWSRSTSAPAPRARSRCTGSRTHRASASCPPTSDGRVLAFVEKPALEDAPTDMINAGAYVVEPSVLDRIPAGRRVSVERETFPAMVADGSLFAAADGDVYWIDAGTPEQYLEAQLDIIDGLRGPGPDPLAPTAPDGGRCDREAVGSHGRRGGQAPGPVWSAPRCCRAVASSAVPRRGLDRGFRGGGRCGAPRSSTAPWSATVSAVEPGRVMGERAARDARSRHRWRRLHRLDPRRPSAGRGPPVDVVDDLSTGSLANLADARADRTGRLTIHQIDIRSTGA